MAPSPEALVEMLLDLEAAAEEAGAPIAGYRADLDNMRARYRDAGMTPEQQGAMMMAAAIRGTLEENEIVWLLLRNRIASTVIWTLAALK